MSLHRLWRAAQLDFVPVLISQGVSPAPIPPMGAMCFEERVFAS